jgi:hypothetical protein
MLKIQKMGAEIQKSQKRFRHYVTKTFFSAKIHFYPVLVWPEGGRGGRKQLDTSLAGARGGVEIARKQPVASMDSRFIDESHGTFCFQPANDNGEVKATVVGDLSELRKSMAQVTDAMAPVRKYLEKVEEDTYRNDQWGLIFDRIDIIFFIFFQLINASALLYVYIASR